MRATRINRAIKPIIAQYKPNKNELAILKKEARCYSFIEHFTTFGITLDDLSKDIAQFKDITMFALRDKSGIYHQQRYKSLREKLSKIFADNGFEKIAENILKFHNYNYDFLRIKDLPHIHRTIKQIEKVIEDPNLKEKITSLLAQYM